MSEFSLEIQIPKPTWDSQLATIILDLEKLRSKQLIGEVPVHIFFQLKSIFQLLETLGSARIEGNNTTLSELVEKVIDGHAKKDEKQKEIENLELAIKFIEENIDENSIISRPFISEIHKIITRDLTPPPKGEGSKSPGALRKFNVEIQNANHTPPDHVILQDHFDEFLRFINTEVVEQNQLLMIAIAHHRFAYIHPFDNGNGRMGRLLNYALLIKLGFQVKNARIINPSSVFYADRDKYYGMLSRADSLDDSDVLAWSEYFLLGLKNEIKEIDSLLSNTYVKGKILLPALKFALDRENITSQEFNILKYLVTKEDMLMKSAELKEFGIENSLQKARVMERLRNKNIVRPIKNNGRIYTINFVNNYLMRGVISSLTTEGFVADFLNNN